MNIASVSVRQQAVVEIVFDVDGKQDPRALGKAVVGACKALPALQKRIAELEAKLGEKEATDGEKEPIAPDAADSKEPEPSKASPSVQKQIVDLQKEKANQGRRLSMTISDEAKTEIARLYSEGKKIHELARMEWMSAAGKKRRFFAGLIRKCAEAGSPMPQPEKKQEAEAPAKGDPDLVCFDDLTVYDQASIESLIENGRLPYSLVGKRWKTVGGEEVIPDRAFYEVVAERLGIAT